MRLVTISQVGQDVLWPSSLMVDQTGISHILPSTHGLIILVSLVLLLPSMDWWRWKVSNSRTAGLFNTFHFWQQTSDHWRLCEKQGGRLQEAELSQRDCATAAWVSFGQI